MNVTVDSQYLRCALIGKLILLQRPQTNSASGVQAYSYRVKIFDGASKRTPRSVRELHSFVGEFTSIKHLCQVLCAELSDDLPLSYNVGYFEGRHHTKKWLTTDQDLVAMNTKITGGDVCLWCDAAQNSSEKSRERSPPRKKSTRRDEKEKDVDDIFQDLKEHHGSEYSGPQLRLWARMICNGLHEDLDNPPNVPMITGTAPKRQKRDSLTEALTGAATVIAKAITAPPSGAQPPGATPSVGLSPCKAADLRMKHFEQLRYLQQLMEDNIISESEFLEQKQIIIDTLRKIT